MSVETLILAAALTAVIHLTLAHRVVIARVWRDARWYERLALVAMLAPIPGPVDELVGVLVIRRVIARRGARS